MWPILLKIGPVPINTFGVILVIAFLVGTWYITRDAVRQGLSGEEIQNLCWLVLGAIVIGGRAMFIITTPEPYLENPLRIFYIWEGGLVYYGGFIGTVFMVVWYAWRHKLPVLKITDLFTVGGMLGLAIGRWGCYFAGDDHGRVIAGATDENHPFWAINFPATVGPWDAHPAMADFAFADQWLYPSQWMMSLSAFLLFILLRFLGKYKKFDGQLTAVLLMVYAIFRSIVELYRGDIDRGVYFQPYRLVRQYALGQIEEIGFYMTTSQFVSVGLFILGLGLYLWKRKTGVAPVSKKNVAGTKSENEVSSQQEKSKTNKRSKGHKGKSRKR